MHCAKRARSTCMALLPYITPTFKGTASQFPFLSRHVELRGNILLISKKPITETPSNVQTVVITPTTPVKHISSTTVMIDRFRFTLRSAAILNALMEALRVARLPRHTYTPVSTLGNGASGVVSLVRREDGELFAMKQIPKYDAFYSEDHLSRAISERVALASAKESQTPFIVSLEDAFETSTHLCLVTELASEDLHTYLASTSEKRLPEDVARQLFAETLLGLEDLHRMGFLYRDMKLNNLLLTSSGHVRLADFGLAKRVETEVVDSSVSSESEEEDEVRVVGRTKSFVGTRRYMSPEHLTSGHGSRTGYGAPADIWALGVVLYIMLTGRYPFGGGPNASSVGLFHAIRNEELVFPEHVSEEARELVSGMLQREWAERLGISEIKQTKFLRSVDWNEVRESAMRDEVVEKVLKIKGVVEKSKIEISDCTSEDCEGTRPREVAQLLGFGYVSTE